MKNRSFVMVIAWFATVALLFGGCYSLPFVMVLYYMPMDYVVEAEFEELPPDDEALQKWLLGQSGVYIGGIERRRNRIVAVWGNTKTFYWNAVTPNLRDQFENFGYKKPLLYKEKKSYRDK
jgi:hypothetical protein